MEIIEVEIEDKKRGGQIDSVDQLVDHHTFNMGVPGSNPGGVTSNALVTQLVE